MVEGKTEREREWNGERMREREGEWRGEAEKEREREKSRDRERERERKKEMARGYACALFSSDSIFKDFSSRSSLQI